MRLGRRGKCPNCCGLQTPPRTTAPASRRTRPSGRRVQAAHIAARHPLGGRVFRVAHIRRDVRFRQFLLLREFAVPFFDDGKIVEQTLNADIGRSFRCLLIELGCPMLHRFGLLADLVERQISSQPNVPAFESLPRRKPRSGGALAPFAPPAVRTKADRAFAGFGCRRAAVAPPAGSVLGCLGPWHRDRIAISNKTPARCRMGSGEEGRLCGVAGYRDPARAPENLRKPMNQARRATSGIAERQWQQVEGLTAKEACGVMRVK